MVDCPYEPDAGTKCTKAVIDYFLYRYDDSDDVFRYHQSLLKDYIDKVLPLKFGLEGNRLRLPSIDNKDIWYTDLDGGDYTDYHDLKDEFAFNTFTEYVNMISDNIFLRNTSNMVVEGEYIVKDKQIIATSTNTALYKDINDIIGIAGVLTDGIVYHLGLCGPTYHWKQITPFRLVIT